MSTPVGLLSCGSADKTLCKTVNTGTVDIIPILVNYSITSTDFSEQKHMLVVNKAGHYIFNFNLLVTLKCPVDKYTFNILNFAGGSWLQLFSASFNSDANILVNESINLNVGDMIVFALSNTTLCKVKSVALLGTIFPDPQWTQLNVFNQVDSSTKVEYILDRPYVAEYPYGYPLEPLLPVQYPNSENQPPSTPSFYIWTSPVIPYNKSATPPPGAPNGDAYLKYQSIPTVLGYYVGLNYLTLPASDPEVVLFLTNWQNRGNRGGVQNYKKMTYMTALTAAVVPYYKEKTDMFINKLIESFTCNNAPVLSTFQAELINYFLALHVGYDVYPDYVVNFFAGFLDIIGIGNPTSEEQNKIVIYGNTVIPEVKAYFDQRITQIVANGDKTCFTYWWSLAGMPKGTMVIEAVHNIFAFSQYNNITYLNIRDKYLGGTPITFVPPPVPPPPPAPTITYDFFGLLSTAQTDQEKLDIIREMFRIFSPNPASFSKVDKTNPDPNIVTARHTHQEIMVYNSFGYPGFPFQPTPNFPPTQFDPNGIKNYYNYDTAKYANFPGTFGACPVTGAKSEGFRPVQAPNKCSMNGKAGTCPVAAMNKLNIKADPTCDVLDNIDPTTLFTVSSVDGETVLDAAQPGFMPVYPTPIYTPFGLGYRRCAAEIFNYMTVIKILEGMAQLKFFTTNQPTVKQITVGPFVQVNDNIFAVTSSNPGS